MSRPWRRPDIDRPEGPRDAESMSKEITVEELAADLEAHIAEVKAGETLTIVEEGKHVATISPTSVGRGVRYPFRDFDPGPRPKNLKTDAAELLIEERERERSGKKYGL